MNPKEKLLLLRHLTKQPQKTPLLRLVKEAIFHDSSIDFKDKEFRKYYMASYRLMKLLNSIGVIRMQKMDGLVWIEILDKETLDLIEAEQNSNLENQPNHPQFLTKNGINTERYICMNICKKHRMLTEEIRNRLKFYFQYYLERIEDKIIVLTPRPPYAVLGYKPKFLKYLTRFNNKSKKYEQLDKYNDIMDIAIEQYQHAIYLTLTTDPKLFRNIYESWRHFSKAWNRFLSYITKLLGFRPAYIAAYEFTKSGLMHVHTVIFGIKWLMVKDHIARLWLKHGQGRIVDIQALQNNGEYFASIKLLNNKKKEITNLRSYLAKYIRKGIFDFSNQYLYFTSNKRYFTYSYKKFPLLKVEIPNNHIYELFITCNIITMPEWLYRLYIIELGYPSPPLTN